MLSVKPFFQSLTVLSSIVIAILAGWNIHITEMDYTAILDNAEQITTAVLALIAIYGRVRANTKIEGVL